jgi:hypothetical protein
LRQNPAFRGAAGMLRNTSDKLGCSGARRQARAMGAAPEGGGAEACVMTLEAAVVRF